MPVVMKAAVEEEQMVEKERADEEGAQVAGKLSQQHHHGDDLAHSCARRLQHFLHLDCHHSRRARANERLRRMHSTCLRPRRAA